MEGARQSLSREGVKRASSKDMSQLRRLWSYLRPYRPQVVWSLVALTVASASVLSIGIGLRHLIDGGFADGRASAINHALEAVMIVVLVLALSTYYRSYLVAWLGERVVADIRADLYAHVIRLPPAFFETTRTGEVISRLTTDTAVVQTVIGQSVTQALRNILILFGGILILLITNPKLTGLVLLVVPVAVLPIVFIGRWVRKRSREAQDRVADVGAQIEETLNAVRTVQAFGQEQREASRFSGHSEAAFTAATAYAHGRGLLGASVIALVFGAIVLVLWIGGHDVLAGRLTAGELASFVFYAVMVAASAGGLSDVAGDLQRAAGAVERLFELRDMPQTIVARTHVEPQARAPGRGELRFERVTFAYPARPDHPILKDLDLELRHGQTVALVGPSGAGKTSVFQLVMRFYDPQSGRITLDGVDLRDMEPMTLRSRLGLVPQEPTIFSADARTNLAYGRPDASEAEIRAAAEAAQAMEFIERLPDGMATFLGEKGVRLSGGQRQRIAIARALLCNPEVLLLDEATSALDAENERLVQLALEGLKLQRTCLVIAHRLATVRLADRIVVMDEGRVVDEGRHEELVGRHGLYSRLASLQFGVDKAA